MPNRFRDTSLGWRWVLLAPVAGLVHLNAAHTARAMPAPPEGACRVERVAGEPYTICSFDPEELSFSVRLKNGDGDYYRRLANLTDERSRTVFAMNGGMYHDDLGPVGLYVEDGAEVKGLQRKRSWGNFGLLPNGVFWVDGTGRVGVTETLRFDRAKRDGRFATQSGPMLVVDGSLHPRFVRGSDSYKIRNGVGVSKDGRVHFALSHGAVNFWTFATLFRDHLATPNALFLDGTVSALRARGYSRGGFWKELGPMIVAERKPVTVPTPRDRDAPPGGAARSTARP